MVKIKRDWLAKINIYLWLENVLCVRLRFFNYHFVAHAWLPRQISCSILAKISSNNSKANLQGKAQNWRTLFPCPFVSTSTASPRCPLKRVHLLFPINRWSVYSRGSVPELLALLLRLPNTHRAVFNHRGHKSQKLLKTANRKHTHTFNDDWWTACWCCCRVLQGQEHPDHWFNWLPRERYVSMNSSAVTSSLSGCAAHLHNE